MIATLTIHWPTCVRCGGTTGVEVGPGDTVVLNLRSEVDGDLPASITAAIQTVDTPLDATSTRIYGIDYDTEDLDGSVDLLVSCMVSSITCVDCCDLLQSQIDALDTRLTAAEATIAEHEARIEDLEARAYREEVVQIQAGQTSVLVDLEEGETISACMQLDVALGFFSFAFTGNTLHCSAAPLGGDLEVVIIIKTP